jgi:hypothetical protein
MYNNPSGGFGGFGGFGDYQAATAPAGGGFMGGFFPSPQKGEGGNISPAGGAVRRMEPSSRDLQGLMSVTIKMVLEQSMNQDGADAGGSGTLRFHNGHEASLLEIVGQVESVEIEPVSMRYVVDDGTGKVVCKKFLDNDPIRGSMHAPDLSRAEVGKFVRVIGPFRRYANESFITAHRVEEIANLDEISRHRIEVIHTYLMLTNALSKSGGDVSGAVSSSSSVHVASDHGHLTESMFRAPYPIEISARPNV